MELVLNNSSEKRRDKIIKNNTKTAKNKLSKEDLEIIENLNKVTKELRFAQLNFDLASDEILTDSFIYEIMSLNKRHAYYIRLCKEKGLVAEVF